MVFFSMRNRASIRVEQARRRQFERVVARALNGLPPEIVAMLDNVDVVVEDEPPAGAIGARSFDAEDETLFGLYEGTPLTERDSAYSMVLPDKITVFRGPLERECGSTAEIAREVRMTVVHELAHHFGLDERQIDELGFA